MKQTATLTTASLLTMLFSTVHLTGDIVFRMSQAGLVNLFAVFFLVVQLYGTLVLGGTRAGYIIIFLCSALGLFISVIHIKGTRGVIGGGIGNSGQADALLEVKLRVHAHIPETRKRSNEAGQGVGGGHSIEEPTPAEVPPVEGHSDARQRHPMRLPRQQT